MEMEKEEWRERRGEEVERETISVGDIHIIY